MKVSAFIFKTITEVINKLSKKLIITNCGEINTFYKIWTKSIKRLKFETQSFDMHTTARAIQSLNYIKKLFSTVGSSTDPTRGQEIHSASI